jgi:hypothetical protein
MEHLSRLSDLRRVMRGSPSSGRPRRLALLALAFVMAAQAMALDHLIGHSARGDNAGCAICVSAGHAGSAIPASGTDVAIPRLANESDFPVVAGQVSQSPPAVYRSRAPPVSA